MLVENANKDTINISEGKTALLFHIPGHCAGCKRAISTLSNMNTDNWKIFLLDAEDESNTELVKQYSVSMAPTIVVFENGEQKEKFAGLKSFLENKNIFEE